MSDRMDTTEEDLLADELAMRAWQVLGNREQVQRWLAGASALAGGDAPVQACATPEVRRRLERQLEWFAGNRRQPSKPVAVMWAGYGWT